VGVLCRVLATLRLVTEAHLQGVFNFSKMDYSEKLKSPKWQKKRLEILERDDFMCQCCGDTESQLQVHHKKYIFGKDVWDYNNDLLITFCSDCHKQVTELKKDVKNRIDLDFIYPEYLQELGCILEVIECFNPYDLMMVRKSIEKYNDKRIKKILKNG
jgi:hypothetical protein